MIRRIQSKASVPTSAVDGGTHQSIARLDILMSALSTEPRRGMRLNEICRTTGLGKATAHRLLSGLVAYRLADFDEESQRYFVGFKIFTWASGAADRYGLLTLARPSLERLVERYQDAVYLTVRSGDEAVCVERLEGSYPIKTLIFEVGSRRPLGIGAGSAAILAALPPTEQSSILARNAKNRRAYDVSDDDLRQIVTAARLNGYTFVDGKIVPGICTVGAAISLESGDPIGAISISSISERMAKDRRSDIASAMLTEIKQMQHDNAPFFQLQNRTRLLAGLPI
ncbi:IclR family transcriptional regulator [Bradyrhizobium roseum]|uniref:IclR family transcriptional regulator n=1 Tax=Bradyrhizobium roseum TaxID=3056648 RepID=UPI00260D93BD|nr:IclR family transcriptional regulator [Bradyrhizobium roseus]WKA26485.1 IclR family transcriptional regulator [Bradyrhizobium roseus]